MEENVIFGTILVLYVMFIGLLLRVCSWLGGKASGRGSKKRKGEERDIRSRIEEVEQLGGHRMKQERYISVAQLRHEKYSKVFIVLGFLAWWKFYKEVHAIVVMIGKPIVGLIMKFISQ